MTIHNHFELRWRDGYGPVSTAHGALALAIEALAATLASSTSEPTYLVRAVQPDDTGDGHAVAVGVLRFDVALSTGSRTLRYLHAIALPPGYTLTQPAWRALVSRRYGSSPVRRIRALYEDLATTTRAAGRDALRDLEISADDVIAVLGSPESALAEAAAPPGAAVAPVTDDAPGTPSPSPSSAPLPAARRHPTAGGDRRPSLALGLALALLVGAAGGWIARDVIPRRVSPTEPTPGSARDDEAATRAKLAAAERALAQLRAQSAADLQQCGASKEALASERRAAQVELAHALDREQATRAELATARTRFASDQDALTARLTAASQGTTRLGDELSRCQASGAAQAGQQDARIRQLTDELARAQAAAASQKAQQDARIQQLGEALRSACAATTVKPPACRGAGP